MPRPQGLAPFKTTNVRFRAPEGACYTKMWILGGDVADADEGMTVLDVDKMSLSKDMGP